MIIPQLLFSGVIVKFDKLHPIFAQEDSVPWIGNVMASRWAYEALAVAQYKRNAFEAPFYSINQKESEASWKRDYWLPELRNQQNLINNYHDDTAKAEVVGQARLILAHEIAKEERLYDPSLNFVCEGCEEALKSNKWPKEAQKSLDDYLKILKEVYKKEVNEAIDESNALQKKIGVDKYKTLKENHYNDALSDFATNRNDLDKIIKFNGKLVQKADPIYKIPRGESFLDAHFYSPGKNLFGQYIPTFWANIIMLWFMTLIFGITLYVDFFRKVIEGTEKLLSRFRK